MPNDSNGRDRFGGDEEDTPADITPNISAEAQSLANLAIAFRSIGAGLWESAQLLDANQGNKRKAFVARLLSELDDLRDVIDSTEKALKGIP